MYLYFCKSPEEILRENPGKISEKIAEYLFLMNSWKQNSTFNTYEQISWKIFGYIPGGAHTEILGESVDILVEVKFLKTPIEIFLISSLIELTNLTLCKCLKSNLWTNAYKFFSQKPLRLFWRNPRLIFLKNSWRIFKRIRRRFHVRTHGGYSSKESLEEFLKETLVEFTKGINKKIVWETLCKKVLKEFNEDFLE